MFGDRDDVGAGNFSDGNTTVGLVRGVQVNVVGSDTSGDTDLEVLRLGETLSGDVTWVEATQLLDHAGNRTKHACQCLTLDLRCGDDDLSVNELLLELAVRALLV